MSGWATLALVTDSDLAAFEPEAVQTAAPWGQSVWPDQRAEAKRELRIWIESDYPDVPGVADRIVDTWVADQVWATTGGTETDWTTEANDDTEADLELATIWTTPASDSLDVGAAWSFDGLDLFVLDTVNANASVLTVTYWNGAAWGTLTATDGTASSGKTCATSGRVSWTVPADWQRRTLHGTGDRYYWVRLTVSAALTANTAATQLLTVRAPDALRRVAVLLTCAYIMRGLAAQSPHPERWLQRGADYWTRAEQLYQKLRDKGAMPIDVDASGAMEPTSEAPIYRPVVLRRG